MAADILLYGTHQVPVGDDQKQHLELTRDLAQRFNGLYGDIFTVPQAFIPPQGARVMSLTDPTRKMSKSDDNAGSFISLLDYPDVVSKKFKRAVTDSENCIAFDPATRPGVSNLLTIISVLTATPMDTLVAQYAGAGYGKLKGDAADATVVLLEPIQARYTQWMNDKTALDTVLREGAVRANTRAEMMLQKVHDALGFVT